AWFDVGFARAVAREVLLELGTLGADDYLDELHALRGELLTSPLRGETNDALAARAAAAESDAQALLVARGALYATRLDALLRARGSSLRALLRALVAQAHERRSAALAEDALLDRIAENVGREELAILRRGVLEGGPIDVPKGALDPCFDAARRTYTRFDLGFDAARSQDAAPMVLRGVRPGGPAAKAGLREGEPLLSLVASHSDPERPVEIVVERGGEAVTITYKPLGDRVREIGWRRNPMAPEFLCPP
ncbi:MAG: hypothetical protein KC486_36670, partial [Myxococcales bacterium]|nr:hypothetical protein [Myxococcales bacterium]